MILTAVAIGCGATLLMDLWNQFLKRAFGTASLNYCMLGRWLRHMPSGTFRHASIAAAAPQRHECMVGWIAHYSIGVGLTLVFVALSGHWVTRPTLWPALAFGVATVVFPLFVLQPSLGVVASARTRLKSLATHVVFGLGLYVGGLALAAVG